MRQRGRVGRLARSVIELRPGLHRQAAPDRPEPPSYLHEPEAQIWRSVVAQRDFNLAARALLDSGLHMLHIARVAREHIEKQGWTITGRGGLPRINPWVRIESRSRNQFHQCLKLLRVRLEFDDDNFIYR